MKCAAEPLDRVGSSVRGGGSSRRLLVLLAAGLMVATGFAIAPGKVAAANPLPSGAPNFGANVDIFTPTMPLSQIQATVNAIATQQVGNQFGTQRYALLFEPGTYGTATNPLNFQIGYYTEVAGLGALPGDTVINGSVDVYNQCFGASNCIALDNFWRSLSNLTINVTTPNAGCYSGEFWAVSQAAPMRRVDVNGATTLMDYCTGPSFASGGFIADAAFTGGTVINGSQQQFVVRNSNLDGWTNGVWNQVFSGDVGAPAQCFPLTTSCGPYTTLSTSPVTEEEPFLYTDATGNYNVFVPAVQHNSSGPAWGSGSEAGTSLPIQKFFVANPTTPVFAIDIALALGKNLILTPGVYALDAPIVVSRPNTVVLGLGFATLVPQHGGAAMIVLPNNGVKVSGLIIDAGPINSPVLLWVGVPKHGAGNAQSSNPDLVQDVFFRIGGATPGSATVSFIDNANSSIIDDVWAWRADHGSGVGWTSNTADTGLIVNGNGVTAYGLFVEHYQKNEVIWNGQGGTDVFFQNEMPYDPPSQAAWMASPGVDGYPAFLVSPNVTSFRGYGMGSYSFFDLGVPVFAANAFQVPTSLPPSSLNDLLTIFLSSAGSGGILNVVDGTGGSSTIANPDTPVTVVSYP
jgi:hypothetical protein